MGWFCKENLSQPSESYYRRRLWKVYYLVYLWCSCSPLPWLLHTWEDCSFRLYCTSEVVSCLELYETLMGCCWRSSTVTCADPSSLGTQPALLPRGGMARDEISSSHSRWSKLAGVYTKPIWVSQRDQEGWIMYSFRIVSTALVDDI